MFMIVTLFVINGYIFVWTAILSGKGLKSLGSLVNNFVKQWTICW